MSVKHIGLVLDHLDVKPATKLVAIVLADHADSDGVCWPSYRRIAQRTNLDERSVRRHIGLLIQMGVVHKIRTGTVRRDGDKVERVTNAYRIDADALVHTQPELSPGACGQVDTAVHLEVGPVVRDRWVPLSTKSSLNHQSLTVSTSEPVDNDRIALERIVKGLAERAAT